MSRQDILNLNQNRYIARSNGRYLSTRLVTHNGNTVAIGLRRAESGLLFFDYSILNAQDEGSPEASRDAVQNKTQSSDESEKLDSQCWFYRPESLEFSSEVRVIGEEAVPVYEIPAVDLAGQQTNSGQAQNLDTWRSSSLCLMDMDVSEFEALSDGRYIYVFRQGLSMSAKCLNQYVGDTAKRPVDGNLLCDRFTLVGSKLTKPLEARYRRSRQKRIRLNAQDTLGVSDINGKIFYEPTFSLRFVRNLVDGRFSVLRTPTITSDLLRWVFFAYSSQSRQIECISTDVGSDGLFDLHGQIYYTCNSTKHDHEKVFANSPGPCTASRSDNGQTCNLPRVPIVPTTSPNSALRSSDAITFNLKSSIDLSGIIFADGFTLEGWFNLEQFWEQESDTGDEDSTSLPPTGSLFCLFAQEIPGSPAVFLDDQLCLALLDENTQVLAKTAEGLKVNEWNHIAVTYNGSNKRTYTLVVNGMVDTSAKYTLPPNTSPGKLCALGHQKFNPDSHFIGLIDEVRVWSCCLHPSIIKTKMKTRASGMEFFLEACWHMDEGAGTTAFDNTSTGNHLSIKEQDRNSMASKAWVEVGAPIAGSFGLAMRALRLPDDVECRGGMSATVYYEQVEVSTPKTDQLKETPDTVAKRMKRSARVLFCFVAALKASSSQLANLAVLDFALLSDGTLCDTPSSLQLPRLSILEGSSQGPLPSASTALLYLGRQGTEVFGGLLDFDAARCGSEAPHAFDSAIGSITIYFRGTTGKLSALKYDISRSVLACSAAALAGHENLLAVSKLRQVQNISIQTSPCKWLPENVALDLEITAYTADGKEIVETWNGVPSRVDQLCKIIKGQAAIEGEFLGRVATLTNPITESAQQPGTLVLNEKLSRNVAAGSCLGVGFRFYMVVKDAGAGDTNLQIVMYKDKKAKQKEPGPQTGVMLLGYDFENLVTCRGKPPGDFTQGSGVISMSESRPMGTQNYAVAPQTNLMNANAKSLVSGSASTPFFASPPISYALTLGKVYSMLEEAVVTAPASGLCFESWLKVNYSLYNRTAVAYCSEHLPRTENGAKEKQTFRLSVLGSPPGESGYDLSLDVNGALVSVNNHRALKFGQWVHFACSIRNSFALKFSGSNFVDLGTAVEWNVSDFTLVFTLHLDSLGETDQILFVKAEGANDTTPLYLKITSEGQLCLSYWAEKDSGGSPQNRSFISKSSLSAGSSYKVFLSRKLVHINRTNKAPRPYQLVTMRAWKSDGTLDINMQPESTNTLEQYEANSSTEINQGAYQTHGSAQTNDAALYIGGAPWASGKGVRGSIGSVQFYSSAIAVPALTQLSSSLTGKSAIGSWSFRDPSGFSLIDDLDRNHGKLKMDPRWVLSPYEPDHQLTVYVDGSRAETERANRSPFTPVGPHQLTLGNVILGEGDTRYLGHEINFEGELDELRIWNVPRTRENICDSMHTRMSDIPAQMAVYLPFDNLDPNSTITANTTNHMVLDASINGWHLTPLYNPQVNYEISGAPIGWDAPCVQHTLDPTGNEAMNLGDIITSGPSVSEYGDMQVGDRGEIEGSFKRAYSYITPDGQWCLVTGFKIGSLLTEWVAQVQTSPTLIGYIEGAPPIPLDTFTNPSHRPSSSIRFVNASRCTYTYSSRSETAHDIDLSVMNGLGAKWEVSTGIGVETVLSSGSVKGQRKMAVNVSKGMVNNGFRTSTANSSMEIAVELTGSWTEDQAGSERYEAANRGTALVESEFADVFALRLQTRGSTPPLVAYQMRPRQGKDDKKSRSLVSFEINRSYTKQGCLDGRLGMTNDPDYPPTTQAPTDASYYKPAEAYALQDRIKRGEEERAGEYQRHSVTWHKDVESLPSRTKRSICNSYIWTADGGTHEQTTSTLDVVQSEVGGNMNSRLSLGASFDLEVAFSNIMGTVDLDAMYTTHFNFVMTKEKTSDEAFELQTHLPPPVDIRQRDPVAKKLVRRPGAVDAYHWMSFWLEPSVEATDVFFNKVVDPVWLEDPNDNDARTLRSLRQSLGKEKANARTKAWRVLHRCTYVSRVPEPITGAVPDSTKSTQLENTKRSALLVDITCNLLLLQKLEPWARAVDSRQNLPSAIKGQVETHFPGLLAQPLIYYQVLDLIGDYVGLP